MNSVPPNVIRVSTPTDTTIVLTRSFNASRQRVWDAFFTPHLLRRWTLLPPGLTMTICECEARVGGALRLVSKSDEADPAMTLAGEFVEVVQHERAVHTETMAFGSGQVVGSLVETHEFSQSNGITTMRITQEYPSKEARDGVADSGMTDGMEACYEQLDALLAEPSTSLP